MDDMAEPKHVKDRSARHASPAPAAWLVLLSMGIASVTFQIDHALDGGLPRWLIAGVVGFAPVTVSLGVSHMIALHKGGKVVRAAAILVMAAGMGLSIGAIGWVVGPYYHSGLRWLFGILLDGAALFALWVLLGEHERRAEQEAAAAAEAKAEQSAQGEVSRLREQITALEGEASRLREAPPVPRPVSRRPSSRKSPGGKKAPVTARSRAVIEDPDLARLLADIDYLPTKAKAFEILGAQPELPGNKLAALLEVDPSRGRQLRREWLASEAAPTTGPIGRIAPDDNPYRSVSD